MPPRQRRYLPNALFGDAIIEQRFEDLYVQCKRFLEPWNRRALVKHDFDGSLLYAATVCSMHDIARYKIYHFKDPARQRLDAVKRAAYYSKWITRLQPIYARRRGSLTKRYNDEDTTLFANEAFAIHTSLNQLRGDPRCKGGKLRIKPQLWASILYDMKFRAMNEDAFISTYQMIFEDVLGQRPTSS